MKDDHQDNITYLTDLALITCVVQNGLSDTLLKAARDVGATSGAISHQARGTGVRERLGLLGIAVEAEREVITLLVSNSQQDLVYDTLFRAGELHIPGRGFIYVAPLETASTYIPRAILDQLEE